MMLQPFNSTTAKADDVLRELHSRRPGLLSYILDQDAQDLETAARKLARIGFGGDLKAVERLTSAAARCHKAASWFRKVGSPADIRFSDLPPGQAVAATGAACHLLGLSLKERDAIIVRSFDPDADAVAYNSAQFAALQASHNRIADAA